MTIALLDVFYRPNRARAACVLAEHWQAEVPTSTHGIDISEVAEYEPGQFFRRELPCLLSVLQLLPVPPEWIVVDGYVWLSSAHRKGLGAYLFEALNHQIPVIGIAKTAFFGAESSPVVAQVLRGESKKPLFVSAVGVDLGTARTWVQGMSGGYRVPTLLTLVDQLSRLETEALEC